ncbi:DUF4129 domain-containing protein [Thermus scotoductus]|uniref:DUF4129 domain-containing protein n=1 Tax=Thermus scotoductus TaxID=37636 RepID=UPI0020A2A73E|nr:DUF4129 domain-containing protein [Thermus scotoductus]
MRFPLTPLLALGLLALLPLWTPPLLLGVFLLHLAKRFYTGAFLWAAFLPGLLHALIAPFPSWLQGWALASGLLLLYGLFLAAKARPLSSLFLLPPALWLGPLGLFLLGLLHGFNLLEEAQRRAQERGEPFWTPLSALWVPGILGLLLSGLAFFPLRLPALPLPALPTPILQASPEARPKPGEEVAYQAPKEGFSPWVAFLKGVLAYAGPLALLLILLALLPLLGRGERLPYRGLHLLPLLLALLAGGLFLLYLGTLGGGESAWGTSLSASMPTPSQESGPKEAVPGPRRLGEVGMALAGLSALFTLGLLSLLAFLVWRHRDRGKQEAAQGIPARSSKRFQETLPQDRVRRAYLQTLKALKALDLPRLASEGPLEYLERVSPLLPGLREPLSELTRLYLPVRYGGRTGEEEAERAEALLGDILRLCSSPASKGPFRAGSS